MILTGSAFHLLCFPFFVFSSKHGDRCLEQTGCDGVMSSEAVLERPGLFSDNVSSVTGLRSSQVLEGTAWWSLFIYNIYMLLPKLRLPQGRQACMKHITTEPVPRVLVCF